ncbi:DUF3078 domain-containing protein [Sphingobacterium sp. SYP-B4668]|uniref:DUF3078 domain-containing protein n=1 Tax=Sphingobacterium sp. SYP-B4668 TaxID=2996035 RepID=UPI0022DE5206|nr:DUF3078 domain-containing protein [Sphingobacterium sp. SYP-B4668]
MKIKFYGFLLFMGFLAQKADAQVNLKELRAKPDSITNNNKQQKLNIKPIDVPIPKLSLEVDYWKHWTRFGINANQAAFSDSWSGGGVNSLALGINTWHKSEFNRNDFNFVTEVDLKYGKVKNKDQMAKKNNDRIFWDNKLAYKLSKSWSLFTSLTFESQFDVGNSYGTSKVSGRDSITGVISAFMAPGYLTESFGLEYKPDNSLSVRFGTGTARQTFILDDRIKPLTVQQYAEKYPGQTIEKDQADKFGVKAGNTFKNDLAFQITANLDKNLSKNINLKSRYNLFANYEKITDPSHRLDVWLTAKVSRVVNVNLNGIVLYDSDDIAKGKTKAEIQFSESLALGLTFNLPK